ncbi:hypothetical protein MLD38_026391 [Melastoma candidum]|uniref:Uncharacterized protein n=1 Tax=Melastoma candidum TaxID=119954 RepID=A0ACB9NY82_9MYRT|nr:hypothetical protein MLD38_026391 [Melastoma candidum]
MRALEAIECGLLEAQRNRKRKKYMKGAPGTFVETNYEPATSEDGPREGTVNHEESGACEGEAKVVE